MNHKDDDIEISLEDLETETLENNIEVDSFPEKSPPERASFFPFKIKHHMEIYMGKDVYDFIEEYSRTDTSRELGGVLIGNVYRKEELLWVMVDAVIEAKDSDSKGTSITFTHKTWEYINKEKDSKFPSKKIVGWFHTHPRFGIFLSKYDLFICQNFFNKSWQVAYVVDPVNDKRGFFYWDKGEIKHSQGFHMYGEQGDAPPPVLRKSRRNKHWFSISLGIGLVFFSFLFFAQKTSIQEELLKTQEELLKTQEALSKTQGEKKIQEDMLAAQKQLPAGINAASIEYEIKKGDTLWDISEKFYGTPWLSMKIAEDNGILKNPHLIEPGRKLKILEVSIKTNN